MKCYRVPMLFPLLITSTLAGSFHDLLLKGGQVIDPKNHVRAIRDVAITKGKIARVAKNIAASEAHKVVDVSSLYVTPGLLDMHVHVCAGSGIPDAYSGDLSVYPDDHTLRSGVTTVVDVGSSGWRNFPDFKDRVIDRSRTRVLAFLNIVGLGMRGLEIEQNIEDMNPEKTAEYVRQYNDAIVGIKTAHYDGPEWVAVERAVEAGQLSGVPVMVDFGTFRPERPYKDLLLRKLRPGDISTHTYIARAPLLDEQSQVMPFLFQARRRGILFDVGHGAGSFVFRQAVPALRQGFPPDTISTDLHVNSMNGGMKNMLNVMSKFLNMGLSLEEVILRSTWKPAQAIKREELGHLSVGARADVAVLRLEKGEFGFVDAYGARLRGSQKLSCELTLRNGSVVWDLNGLTRKNWDELGKYGYQTDRRWSDTIRSTRAPKYTVP